MNDVHANGRDDKDVECSSSSPAESVAVQPSEEQFDSTHPAQHPHHHTIATAVLCSCSLSNAFLLVSFFPYSGFMALQLVPTATAQTAGAYAGILASSFMAGRFLTAYEWGRVGDIYGRVFVLQSSLILSAAFSILFGFSTSFSMALFWRFCLGASNGIISTTKTCALEIGHGDEAKERRAVGWVMGMRGWGQLLSPAAAGFLAEPLQQYPNILWLQDCDILRDYPFLLPNIMVAFVCMCSAASVALVLEETLPECRHPNNLLSDLSTWISHVIGKICCSYDHNATASDDEKQMLLQPDATKSISNTDESIWDRPITRQHMMVHWFFAFFSTLMDEAFPLYCMFYLGLSEATIGQTLSLAGILFVCLQYPIYSATVKKLGLYKSSSLGCLAAALPAAIIPFASIIRDLGSSHSARATKWTEIVFLSVIVGLLKVMTSLYFASMSLATNKTVDTSQRAKLNALVLVGVSVAKAAGPVFAGSLVSFSLAMWSIDIGGFVVFFLITGIGLVVARKVKQLERFMTQ